MTGDRMMSRGSVTVAIYAETSSVLLVFALMYAFSASTLNTTSSAFNTS